MLHSSSNISNIFITGSLGNICPAELGLEAYQICMMNVQVTAQRQSSLGLSQNVIRPGSVGNMQRQPSAGLQTPAMTTQRQVGQPASC